jgi:hypothetical protein
MKISHYSFGNITIDGETYTKDIIIYPDHIFSPWWRKEGHLLQVDDLTEVINVKLPLLIVGTGYYNTMKLSEDTLDILALNNIEVLAENTQEAIKLFNEISSEKPVVAALHLTC